MCNTYKILILYILFISYGLLHISFVLAGKFSFTLPSKLDANERWEQAKNIEGVTVKPFLLGV